MPTGWALSNLWSAGPISMSGHPVPTANHFGFSSPSCARGGRVAYPLTEQRLTNLLDRLLRGSDQALDGRLGYRQVRFRIRKRRGQAAVRLHDLVNDVSAFAKATADEAERYDIAARQGGARLGSFGERDDPHPGLRMNFERSTSNIQRPSARATRAADLDVGRSVLDVGRWSVHGWPNRSCDKPLRILVPIRRAKGARGCIAFQTSRKSG